MISIKPSLPSFQEVEILLYPPVDILAFDERFFLCLPLDHRLFYLLFKYYLKKSHTTLGL
jgi:hypothetical protein